MRSRVFFHFYFGDLQVGLSAGEAAGVVLGKCRRFYCVYGGLFQCSVCCIGVAVCVAGKMSPLLVVATEVCCSSVCVAVYIKVDHAGKMSRPLFCLRGSVAVQCV